VTIAPGGSFAAEWQTDLAGRLAVRAVIPLAAASALSQPVTATSSLTVTVYRVSLATQYGPGFYGRHTACGQKLTVTTVGVANRTLRCGTPIAIYYRSRTLVAPVIDRGPYANGADWDLTAATARELRIPGTAMIGAVALPRKFAQPRS
jgi:rare lipoprotein A (peptidoglycan hydrolase)